MPNTRRMMMATAGAGSAPQLYAWGGTGQTGKLNQGSVTSVPTVTLEGIEWLSICLVGGNAGGIGIRDDGTAWAWGKDERGQTAQGIDSGESVSPRQIGALSDWTNTWSSGAEGAMALRNNNTLWAWGYGTNGQLGNGASVTTSSPVQVGSASNIVYGSMTDAISHYVDSDGKLWWTGDHDARPGEAGHYSAINTPNQVGSATDWARVQGYKELYGVLKTNGDFYTWGRNTHGGVGNGTKATQATPVQISSNVAQFAMGIYHQAYIDTSGRLWTCGTGASGTAQAYIAGHGDNVARSTPVQVGSRTDWNYVFCSTTSTFATTTGGELYGWGLNTNYALGDGTLTARSSPVQIGAEINWNSPVGAAHTQLAHLQGTP